MSLGIITLGSYLLLGIAAFVIELLPFMFIDLLMVSNSLGT